MTSSDSDDNTTIAMIQRCFHYQHPHEFGRLYVETPALPADLYHTEDLSWVPYVQELLEEPMGAPDAYHW